MHNLDVILPDEVYVRLNAEAERSKEPASALARQAIDTWLRQRCKGARHEAIREFAAECAGTELDLDPKLAEVQQ